MREIEDDRYHKDQGRRSEQIDTRRSRLAARSEYSDKLASRKDYGLVCRFSFTMKVWTELDMSVSSCRVPDHRWSV
jgi:hypothetical protein